LLFIECGPKAHHRRRRQLAKRQDSNLHEFISAYITAAEGARAYRNPGCNSHQNEGSGRDSARVCGHTHCPGQPEAFQGTPAPSEVPAVHTPHATEAVDVAARIILQKTTKKIKSKSKLCHSLVLQLLPVPRPLVLSREDRSAANQERHCGISQCLRSALRIRSVTSVLNIPPALSACAATAYLGSTAANLEPAAAGAGRPAAQPLPSAATPGAALGTSPARTDFGHYLHCTFSERLAE